VVNHFEIKTFDFLFYRREKYVNILFTAEQSFDSKLRTLYFVAGVDNMSAGCKDYLPDGLR